MAQRKIILLSVDGVPGSGKSERMGDIVDALSSTGKFAVLRVDEPVKEFIESGLLTLYYGDQKKYGFMFQVFAATQRFRKLRNAIDTATAVESNLPIVLVSERCIDSDAIFMKTLHDTGVVTPKEYEIYEGFRHEWIHLIPTYPPVAHLFICCPTDVSLERIRKRGRESETTYSRTYQIDLERNHDEYAARAEANGVPVMRITSEMDKEVPDSPHLGDLRRIVRFVSDCLAQERPSSQ